MPKPRLIVNCATNEIGLFKQAAEAAASMSDHYDMRMVVNHLARKDTRELTDPGDPYLQYSVNFPQLFHFIIPLEIEPFVERSYVQANLDLMDQKMAVLRELGIKGAFFGREPVYFREPVYQKYPHWRGPRVDHPRRSRNPVYAMCLHQPEVQELYRMAAGELCDRYPDLDTFYWWSNDSGSGFCWYDRLYCGPNGPEACRDQGPIPAIAAFNKAILDGAKAGGASDPMSVMLHTFAWDEQRMPPGAYRYPSDETQGGVKSLGADLSMTYPVRWIWDPIRRLAQFGDAIESEPCAVICWMSDIYHRASPDIGTIRRYFKLWRLAARSPAASKRLPGRLALLSELARSEFGPDASDDAVDGWIKLHEAFVLQLNNPYPTPFLTYLPMYGPVSHRWLTRPFVAFPSKLSSEEEDYFFPHVFVLGDEARRTNLLDLHGYPMADAREDYRMRTNFFTLLSSHLESAADRFESAARKAEGPSRDDLAITAKACKLMACLWKNAGNWIEYAVLQAQGTEKPAEAFASMAGAEREVVAAYRNRMEQIFHNELHNIQALQEILGGVGGTANCSETVIVRGAEARDEDAFTLGPDLSAQLSRKRQIMLAHWDDMKRLYPI